MKRPGITPTLAGLNLLLVLLLAALWLTPQGTLRGVHWPVPSAVAPQLGQADEVPLPAPAAVNASRFLATLERPLFSPTRRPPPPAPAQNTAPEADPLADIQLQGLYTGPGGGGLFAKVAGKNLRVPVGGKLGGWDVKSINDREVTLARGAQTHTLRLAPAKLSKLALPPPKAAAAPAAAAGSPAPATATPATPVPSQTDNPALREQQEREERQRARRALNNQRRIANGLPPLPDDR